MEKTPTAFPWSARALQWYYYITPIFIVLDLGFDLDFRVTYLATMPIFKWSYYALMCGCAYLVWKFPRGIALTGLLESLLNIILLCGGFFAAYTGAMNSVLANDAEMANPFTWPAVVNFILSGAVLVLAWKTNPLLKKLERMQMEGTV
jgi:hypothetical protein